MEGIRAWSFSAAIAVTEYRSCPLSCIHTVPFWAVFAAAKRCSLSLCATEHVLELQYPRRQRATRRAAPAPKASSAPLMTPLRQTPSALVRRPHGSFLQRACFVSFLADTSCLNTNYLRCSAAEPVPPACNEAGGSCPEGLVCSTDDPAAADAECVGAPPSRLLLAERLFCPGLCCQLD